MFQRRVVRRSNFDTDSYDVCGVAVKLRRMIEVPASSSRRLEIVDVNFAWVEKTLLNR